MTPGFPFQQLHFKGTHMTLTLQAIAETAASPDAVYFVIQRSNGHWSPAATILHVMDAEWKADDMALKLKFQHPQQDYGVAKLRSEAREVRKPIEIVRMEER